MEIQDGCQGHIFVEKMAILPVDYHGDNKIGPIVFMLDRILLSVRTCHMEDRLKSEIQNGRQGAFFSSFFTVNMTHLPLLNLEIQNGHQ